MVDKRTTHERRAELVAATLRLLAEVPCRDVTTRAVAERCGITQPAIFRHFASREELLLGVLGSVRGELGSLLERVLVMPADERLVTFLGGVLDYALENPGLPRLLLSDIEEGPVRTALASLMATQLEVLTELTLPRLPPGTARSIARDRARLVLALFQGLLVQQIHLGGLSLPPPPRSALARAITRLLEGELTQGESDGRDDEAKVRGALRILDARPLLASGQEPFATIVAQLDELDDLGVFELTTPFPPRPLIGVLAGRGYRTFLEERAPGMHVLLAIPEGVSEPLDLRDLPAPEPLERLLLESEGLAEGDSLLALTPHLPRLLATRLEARGFEVEMATSTDSTGLVRVRRKRTS